MPLYKFGVGDVFHNRIKAHPSSSFYIYSGSVYYNNKSTEPGSFVSNVNGVPVGNVSLFELNVDRAASDTGRIIGISSSVADQNISDTGLIYPFVYKSAIHKAAFKGITRKQFIHNYDRGDVITGSYMMSASITRKSYKASARFNDTNIDGAALRNSLDFAKRMGQHYDFPSGSSTATTVIDIPSIFYGSEIKKGTVDLNIYITGTLVARARDSQYNGALIQESGDSNGHASSNDGQTVGVVLYNEGLIILTSSAQLHTESFSTKVYDTRDNSSTDNLASNASWLTYGAGLLQGAGLSLERLPAQDFLQSASFGLDFAGTQRIPTVTMLAHANKGELNYTNNPTYIEYGQTEYYPTNTGILFDEKPLNIKNIHSASYSDPTGSLKKTTYITKVGIYDENKKLIGVASVAKPVKKTEERDLTFKLKLDI